MAARAKWTFMVYMAGDNNLAGPGEEDLDEMRAAGSTPDVHVVVEFDRAGSSRATCRYYIPQPGAAERVVSLGETDCGDPRLLLDFIRWTAQEYPAERYALVLWSHGSGWEPAEIDRVARSVGAADYHPREATERAATPLRRALFRSTMERLYRLPTRTDRAICVDDGSGHALDTVELGRVLGEAAAILGQPVDLLGMDACLMSNVEVAYQLRRAVHYLVGSEESEPASGWPYDLILHELAAAPDMSAAALAGRIVTAYVGGNAARRTRTPVTLSALRLASIDGLAAALDGLAGALVAAMPAAVTAIWQAQRRSTRFWHDTLWDIAHFCEQLANTSGDEGVRQASRVALAALQPDPEALVVAAKGLGAEVERCGGVSIYLPPPAVHTISRFYAELDFAAACCWPALLRAYHES